MPCTFGGQPCEDPIVTARACVDLGYPVDFWLGKANRFSCPLGQEPGSGKLLILRQYLNRLSLNTLYDLTFIEIDALTGAEKTRTTLKNIVIVRATNVTPGRRGTTDQAYLVEVSDRRRLARAVPIDRAYNLRSTPGGAFYSASRNGGVDWTWATMTESIWNTVGKLGAFPGLPFAPHGTPEGFVFYGQYAYDALAVVFDRLSVALKYDPVTDIFSIVRLAVADAQHDTDLARRDPVHIWDGELIDGTRARIPVSVRVHFPRQRAAADTTGASPWETVDVADATPGGALPGTEAGTFAILYDDLPAIYNSSGVLTNGAALTARAAERAADFFRKARLDRLHRVYSGAHRDSGLLPGARLKATVWEELGVGIKTEVGRFPGLLGPDNLPRFDNEGDVFDSSLNLTFNEFTHVDFNFVAILNQFLSVLFNLINIYITTQGTTAITVREVDLAPTYPNINTLEFDSLDGFTITNPAAGVARVDFPTNALVIPLYLCMSNGGPPAYQRVTILWPGPQTFTNPGNLNNVSLDPGVSCLKVTTNANITISGVAPPSDDSMLLFIENAKASTGTITIPHESASSSAANRFTLPGATNVTIGSSQVGEFLYNKDDNFWYLVGISSPAMGTLTVEGADGAPSYPSIDTLALDEDDGFVITNPSAGTARLDFTTPGCATGIVGDQAITTATDTAIQFDAADAFDTHAFHDPTTNNTRLTVFKAGTYLVGAAVTFEANATGQRHVWFKVTNVIGPSTSIQSKMMVDAAAANETALVITGVFTLGASDYVEVFVRQNSGGNLNVLSGPAGGGDSQARAWIFAMG